MNSIRKPKVRSEQTLMTGTEVTKLLTKSLCNLRSTDHTKIVHSFTCLKNKAFLQRYSYNHRLPTAILKSLCTIYTTVRLEKAYRANMKAQPLLSEQLHFSAVPGPVHRTDAW